MATEKQLAFFVSLYTQEQDRLASLKETARAYLGLASLYSAFILYVTEKMRPVALAPKILFALAITTMLLAFLTALRVLQVATYERLRRPTDIIESFGDEPPSDEDFFDDRIIDYTVACERNGLVNNRKASYLAASGYFFLVGLIVHASYFVIWLFDSGAFAHVQRT